jgi:hypothetical protein
MKARAPELHGSPWTLARADLALLALGVAMCVFLVASPWIIRTYDYKIFNPLLIASGAIAIAAVRLAPRVTPSTGLAIVLGVGLLMRAIVLFYDPLFSTDIYRYVWDGRVQGAGINPYRYVPADPNLAFLRDTAVYPGINRADYAVTAYPPIAQVFFLLVTRISDSVNGMRLGLIACEGVIVMVMLDLLRRLHVPPVSVAAWAWHPLVIWEVANNGHVDALMVALLMVGVWLLVTHRAIAGAIAVTMAALVKPYALAALPAFWRPFDWRVPAAVVAALGLSYLPYLGVGSGVFGFINSKGYLAEEGHVTGDGFWLVAVARFLFGDVGVFKPAYLVAGGLVLSWLALRAAMRREPTVEQSLADVTTLIVAGVLILSPNYPWYYLTVVPFAVLGAGAPAWALSLAAILLYGPIVLLHHNLAWKTLATLPFLITLAWLWFAKRSGRTPGSRLAIRASDAHR